MTVCTLRAGQIVPDKLIVPMKFSDTVNVTGTSTRSYVYSQNSAFDPNVTGTGASVVGYNSLQALYGRCRVFSSKIKVSPVSSDAFISYAVAAGNINYGTSASAIGVASLRNARPEALKWVPYISGGGVVTADANSFDEIETAKLAGSPLYNSDEYYSLGAADPATQFYWTIAASAFLGGSFAAVFHVELEYLVEWSLPQDSPS
jgi:hypothetical protein